MLYVSTYSAHDKSGVMIISDAMPGALQFSGASFSVSETSGAATITVTRAGGSSGAVSVDYATSDGTANAGGDYTATSGTLNFADGETSKTFNVPLTDDAQRETNETVHLTLSNAGGAALGNPGAAVLTIVDDDAEFANLSAPAITYGTATANITGNLLGGSFTPTGQVAVTLNGVTQQAAINPADGSFTATFAANALTPAASPYAINFEYAGDAVFHALSATGSLAVNPATLTVTADNKFKTYGQLNPPLTFTYAGFVNGENAGALTGAPDLSTNADENSDAGQYPITITQGTLASVNYAFTFANGTLFIEPAAPVLKIFGGTFAFDNQPHPATGTATGVRGENLGALTFTYNGHAVAPVAVGLYEVVGAFAGNVNYRAASQSGPRVVIYDPDALTDRYQVTNLGTLGGPNSYALAVNAGNAVVGFSDTANGEIHAFLYADGAMSDLGTLGGAYSVATAINDAGVIVGYAQTATGQYHAFRYSGGAMADLGTLGGADSFAYGLNEAGQIVGDSFNAGGVTHAFLYDGALHDLGALANDADFSRAMSVNNAAQIVGQSVDAAGGARGFIAGDAIGMQDLNPLLLAGANVVVTDANGLNDGGRIAALGDANGQTVALLLKPVKPTTTSVPAVVASFSTMQQLVALTANVTAAGGGAVNQGTVTFTVRNSGGAVVGAAATSGTVTNGAATANYTLPAGAAPGDYSIEAAYNPGENFAGSAGAGALTIQKAATSVALASSVNPSAFGQSVTFTATVAAVAPGSGAPAGAVQFKINGVNAAGGLKTLVNGQASYTTNTLPAGSYIITAEYQGNASYNASSGTKSHRRR
jgi:probable HAF family extracellular repeat protein